MSSSTAALEALLGPKVVKSNGGGEVSTTSILADTKTVLLYFSARSSPGSKTYARWSSPNKAFAPIISKAYKEYVEKHTAGTLQEMEVLFCSWDSSVESFQEFHQKEMSFPALPFSPELGKMLGEKYEVEMVPSLVLIDTNDGSVITKDFDLLTLVEEHGSAAFPLTARSLPELKEAKELKKKTMLEELRNGTVSCMVKREKKEGTDYDTEEEIPLAALFQDYEYVCLVLGDDNSYLHNNYLHMMKQVNDDAKNSNRLVLVYLAVNNDGNHSTVFNDYPFSNLEPSDELKSCIKDIAEGEFALVMLLHQGKGIHNIDGTFEEDDVLYLVNSPPETSFNFARASPKAFPWDRAAMTAYEEHIKEVRESLAKFDFLKTDDDDGKQLLLRGDKPTNIKEVLASLENGEDDDVVLGLYFSQYGHLWGEDFAPKLVKAFGELKEAGKRFEIIFVSSDFSKEDFESHYKEMKTASSDQFLALDYDERDLRNDLIGALDVVNKVPALVFLKPDGTIISKDGTEAIELGALVSFPFDEKTLERAKKAVEERHEKEREAALVKEKEDAEKAKAGGNIVLERVVGPPGSIAVDYSQKTMEFLAYFPTAIASELLTKIGVLYYELEFLEMTETAQFGFAVEGAMEDMVDDDGTGTGDNDKSWGFDGFRRVKFHDGSDDWPFDWGVGTVIGLAANMETGMIAASIDGEWSDVAFQNELIKDGVYPSMTAHESSKVRYAFSAFKHSPPSDSLWKSD